ncbi:MAG: DUF255 domain-containing protein [Fimbriimonas sp.]
MLRPSFGVSALVVGILVGTAFLSEGLRPLLPPRVSNRMGNSPSAFLRQASSQPIDWRTLTDENVARARREGKPILLLVGASWSNVARQVDRDTFTDPDVARLLRRYFICIRVDGTIRPEYLNGFLPLTRLRNGFLPGFQIWILNAKGDIINFEGRSSSLQSFDRKSMLNFFTKSRDLFAASLESGRPPDEIAQQATELKVLRAGSGMLLPDYIRFRGKLATQIDPMNGGMPERGFQNPPVRALRFLLLAGDRQTFRRAFDSILTSPLYDLQEGGFFRFSGRQDWSDIDFNKVAVQNAEWLELLVTAYLLLGDPAYQKLAIQTLDFLLDELCVDGRVWGAQVGRQGRNGRSQQFSISPQQIQAWSTDDQTFARDELGLQPYINRQMVPRLRSLQTLQYDERIRKLLDPIHADHPIERAVETQADIQGFVTAKMLYAANALQDKVRVERVLQCLDRLEALRSGETVLPSTATMPADLECLSDYLSVSDAYLQDFFVNGWTPSFDAGLKVLRRAIDLFSGEVEGEFLNSPSATNRMGALSTLVPEIADTVRESTSAQAIRLLLDYGRILGPTPEGRAFRKKAYASCGLYSRVVETYPSAGGFFAASMPVADDATFLCVGPQAIQLSHLIARQRPGRLVIPVVPGIRPDLRPRKPGVYVEERGELQGPYSVADALDQVPLEFRLISP